MVQFNIGDRVTTPPTWGHVEGVICHPNAGLIGVRLDNYNPNFHNCQGTCEMGHGWYFSQRGLTLIEPAKVLTKQELICNKIKYLKDKFDRRKGVQTI